MVWCPKLPHRDCTGYRPGHVIASRCDLVHSMPVRFAIKSTRHKVTMRPDRKKDAVIKGTAIGRPAGVADAGRTDVTGKEVNEAVAPILLAAGIVFAGAVFALSVPLQVAAFVTLMATLRICWLEDNIASDLVDAQELPGGYVNAIRKRQRLLWALLRLSPGKPAETRCPLLVATSLRAQSETLSAAVLSVLAVLTLRDLDVYPVMAALIGLPILVAAFWRADQVIEAVTCLHAERPIPRERFFSWVSSRRGEERRGGD